jgi:hypothetical protein
VSTFILSVHFKTWFFVNIKVDMRFLPNVDYYVDSDGVLHVSVDGNEIATASGCGELSATGLNDVVFRLLEEYGYL